jgi:voltage-gated potassium channel
VTGLTSRRVVGTIMAVAALLGAGTLSFRALLDEPWHAALYRTIVTATLVGLDSTPHGVAAEFVTIGVVLGGVAIFGYLVAQLLNEVATNIASGAWRDKRRRRMIGKLENHFIICGFGRVGRRAAEELAASGQPFVVLDFSRDALAAARERNVLFLEGSGSDDDDLKSAGIDRARGLLASADSDAENLYITLSARTHRRDLTIVARASDADAARKLQLAGADRVVQPYSNAGIEMAKLAFKPQVAAFLELVSTHGGPDLRFEEVEVKPSCAQVGRTIRELRIRHETGALVVAMRKADGTFDTTPDPDTRLAAGDVLIAMGAEDELRALEDLLAPAEAVAR